jgi:LacI family transcriptional regulator
MSVGFIVGDISNPLMSHIALGAETTLGASGYMTLLANSRNDPSLDVRNLRLFRQRRVDGMLVSLVDEESDEIVAELQRHQGPFVLIDRSVQLEKPTSAVLFDHRTGFREAAEHLLRLGHRRIGLITGASRVRFNRERVEAVREAASLAGATVVIAVGSSATRSESESSAITLIDSDDPPTAIICAGNQFLPGLLNVVRARTLRIPEDMSIVTTDRTEIAEFHTPPIAAIDRDTTEMGRVAASRLLDEIHGAAPSTTLLPTTFHPAESCGPPRKL